jgi:Flp pilus assembly protein TadB
MKLLGFLVRSSNVFPEVAIESRMLKPLKSIYPDANEYRYMGEALVISLVFSLLVFISFLSGSPETAAISFFVSFVFVFLFLLALPGFELGRKAAMIEAEMPFVLRTIGLLVNMGIPFTKCLSMVSEEDNETARELRKVVSDIKHGITVEKAFSRFAVSFNSFPIKRSVSQLLSVYDVGGGGTEIKRVGDELLAVQQHRMKEHSSKSAIFGMLFIMTSAILPTFFLVYVILGEFGVGGEVSQPGMAIALLLVFPAISVLLLLVSKASVPYSPLSSDKNVIDPLVILPALMFILSFLFLSEGIRIFGLLVGGVIMLWALYKNYKSEKRTEEIEQYLPDALFTISSLPKSVKLEKIFETIENSDYGALSEEAGKSKRQVSMNVKTDTVIEDLWMRNDSPALKKAATMLKHVFDTNSFGQLHSIAEDLLKVFEIKRERAQLMSMQKYTILFGGFLIPMILKIALSLINSLVDFFDNPAAPKLIAYVISLIPAYLVLYSLISAFYIADIEGKKSMAAFYFLILVTVSLLTFNFVGI